MSEQKTTWQRTKDSFVNFVTRTGIGAGSQADGAHYQNDFRSRDRQGLEAAYRTNWVAGLAVDTVAKDMTRAGTRITSEMDPDDRAKIERAIVRMKIWDKMRDTIRWSRLYGGAIGVLLVDGQHPASPLRTDTVGPGQFKGMIVFDRWMVTNTFNDLVEDYGPDMGKPRFYNVIDDPTVPFNGNKIHHTRVIRFEGVDLPHYQAISENGWGQSVLERVWDRMVALDSATTGAGQLVYRAHLRTYSVPGLREILATGGPAYEGLIAQVDFMRQTQSNEGITLMDGEDEFQTSQYSFAGVSDIIMQFAQQVSGALQIPLVRFLGQSPAGLSSTGESDLRTYYDNVHAEQDSELRVPMHVVYELISRSELGQELDEDFSFEFASLWQLTEIEKSNIARDMSQALGTMDMNGTITHGQVLRELRNLSKTTGYFGSITDEDITEADAEPPTLPEPPKPGAKTQEVSGEDDDKIESKA